jgi:hypothetical protein
VNWAFIEYAPEGALTGANKGSLSNAVYPALEWHVCLIVLLYSLTRVTSGWNWLRILREKPD